MKQKVKIISILLIIFTFILVPIVKAENETNNIISNNSNNTTATVDTNEENNAEQNQSTSINEGYKNQDAYLIGDDIVIDDVVDGNLFVIANSVTINSQIGGDVFVLSDNLTFGETSYIYGNVFALSKNITTNGIICDLYSISNDLEINGYILRDIRISSNNVNISGSIRRNAYISCDNLNLIQSENSSESPTSQILIAGNLNYSSTQEASIPEGSVSGEVNFDKQEVTSTNQLSAYLTSLATFLATIIIIWLVYLWLAPNFLKNSPALLTTKKIFPVLGLGILTPIVLILLSILLLFLGVTSTLGLILLIMLCIFIAISTSTFIITLNNAICNKLKIKKTFYKLGMLIVCSIILSLVGFIPHAGSIIEFIIIILGLGIITYSLIVKNKEKIAE